MLKFCISALVESRLTLIKLLQKLSIDQLYEVLSLYNQAKLSLDQTCNIQNKVCYCNLLKTGQFIAQVLDKFHDLFGIKCFANYLKASLYKKRYCDI
jgi:hypothetical protein